MGFVVTFAPMHVLQSMIITLCLLVFVRMKASKHALTPVNQLTKAVSGAC